MSGETFCLKAPAERVGNLSTGTSVPSFRYFPSEVTEKTDPVIGSIICVPGKYIPSSYLAIGVLKDI